jgi:hypothetical protein
LAPLSKSSGIVYLNGGLFSSEHAANKPTNLKQIKFSNTIS